MWRRVSRERFNFFQRGNQNVYVYGTPIETRSFFCYWDRSSGFTGQVRNQLPEPSLTKNWAALLLPPSKRTSPSLPFPAIAPLLSSPFLSLPFQLDEASLPPSLSLQVPPLLYLIEFSFLTLQSPPRITACSRITLISRPFPD